MARRKIRIGISSCLLGDPVRYNGGHKRDRYITDVLSEHFEYVPYCPEVAIGLGVPRATIRLESSPLGTRAVQPDAGNRDVTDKLADYGRRVASEAAELDGYIFKSRSPSCGPARVKLYGKDGAPAGSAAGIYAAAFRGIRPLLPVEDEGRLNDADLRDNFFERVLVHHRWRQLRMRRLTPPALARFHREHRFLLLARNQTALRELGRLAAKAGSDIDYIAEQYGTRLMQALSRPARRGNQANALQHVAGFLGKKLDAGDRRDLALAIDGFREGTAPIIVALTLIRRHLRRHGDACVESRHFPAEQRTR